MVYLVVALGQFGVILLTAMAKAVGLIAGTTALFICIIVASAAVLHAACLHLARRQPESQAAQQAPTEPSGSAPSP